MPPVPEDDLSSLQKARERLYKPGPLVDTPHGLTEEETKEFPHDWKEEILRHSQTKAKRHIRVATLFFFSALGFFIIAIAIATYVFSVGGNTVSVDKIAVSVRGSTTIASGDVVPLSITVSNNNAVSIQNASIDIAFPDGTRDATDVTQSYPRYSENLGTLKSGETVTRSIRVVLFGGSGQTLTLPVNVSYSAEGSSAVFVKKEAYPVVISTTPLSLSVDALSEIVSGQPFTLTLTVRSNVTVPLTNVVVQGTLPFGFSVTGSSGSFTNSSFILGNLAPGAKKTVTLTGILLGQQQEQRTFRFVVGTAKSSGDQTPALTYMSVDTPVTIAAPFINTNLSINGDSSSNLTLTSGAYENVSLSYTNTLGTNITNATISVTLSGGAVDYNSIQTTNGFYRSSDHTVLFSRDTDPSLAQLSPGASGIGTFSFSTLPPNSSITAPSISLTTSVSGTRVGESNVPENVTASNTRTFKVVSAVTLSATALYSSGVFPPKGPLPPRVDQATTYTIVWKVQNQGSSVAGGLVKTILPSYVTYTNQTNGTGSFNYDDTSRTVSWNTGDLLQGATAQGAFQVSLTPSSSQRGSAPQLTGPASFTGFDRFAGVGISASADPVTTGTIGDPGYVSTNAVVQ